MALDSKPMGCVVGLALCALSLAVIEDILTIRADRDVYYYGCDALFERHPEVIQHLCNYAAQQKREVLRTQSTPGFMKPLLPHL